MKRFELQTGDISMHDPPLKDLDANLAKDNIIVFIIKCTQCLCYGSIFKTVSFFQTGLFFKTGFSFLVSCLSGVLHCGLEFN